MNRVIYFINEKTILIFLVIKNVTELQRINSLLVAHFLNHGCIDLLRFVLDVIKYVFQYTTTYIHDGNILLVA